MALDTLTSALEQNLKWTAQKNISGRNPLIQQDTIRSSHANGTAKANNTSGGADELCAFMVTVTPSNSATIDTTAITDILQQTVNLARIKGWRIELRSYTDDPTLGTNCLSIAVGNAATNQQNLNLGVNSLMTIDNGGVASYSSPKATGIASGASARSLKVLNNDNTNSAAVLVCLIGTTN